MQWRGGGIAGGANDPDHSPLWYLIGSALVAEFGVNEATATGVYLICLPYVLFGVLLGASVWYVSRRLYGNAGGYIALSLYCFSPSVIRTSALWFSQPDITAVWGTFGAVFTGVAVSHTLYAPREVVLWNWRRTLLLGISLALAVGSQFSLVIAIPALLIFMIYLAPERRAAASAILAAACVIAGLLLFASYFFHPALFVRGLMHARWFDVSGRAATMRGAYLQVAREIAASGPALALLAPEALITFAIWRRSRYFGNTAPLSMTVLFLGLRVLAPHEPESVFTLAGVVFLVVFVAGIAADLLETKALAQVWTVLIAVLSANALWNLMGLAQIAR